MDQPTRTAPKVLQPKAGIMNIILERMYALDPEIAAFTQYSGVVFGRVHSKTFMSLIGRRGASLPSSPFAAYVFGLSPTKALAFGGTPIATTQ